MVCVIPSVMVGGANSAAGRLVAGCPEGFMKTTDKPDRSSKHQLSDRVSANTYGNLEACAAVRLHRRQSSSASRPTAGAAGFLNLSQSGERPDPPIGSAKRNRKGPGEQSPRGLSNQSCKKSSVSAAAPAIVEADTHDVVGEATGLRNDLSQRRRAERLSPPGYAECPVETGASSVPQRGGQETYPP